MPSWWPRWQFPKRIQEPGTRGRHLLAPIDADHILLKANADYQQVRVGSQDTGDQLAVSVVFIGDDHRIGAESHDMGLEFLGSRQRSQHFPALTLKYVADPLGQQSGTAEKQYPLLTHMLTSSEPFHRARATSGFLSPQVSLLLLVIAKSLSVRSPVGTFIRRCHSWWTYHCDTWVTYCRTGVGAMWVETVTMDAVGGLTGCAHVQCACDDSRWRLNRFRVAGIPYRACSIRSM